MKVWCYEDAADVLNATKVEFQALPLPQFLQYYALCVIHDKQVMFSGGMDDQGDRPGLAFLPNSESGLWVDSPPHTSLHTPRSGHACTATETAAYIFGGRDRANTWLNSFERLGLEDEYDWDGNMIERVWTAFVIPELSPRNNTLMATVSKTAILIAGGFNGNRNLNDGILLDPETKCLTRTLSFEEDLKFVCEGNAHIVTSYSKVIALVRSFNKVCLVEVAGDGSQVT